MSILHGERTVFAKRNLLLSAFLAASLVATGVAEADAAAGNDGAEYIVTQPGGTLSLTVEQYSVETVDVKVHYSGFLYPDTVIDVVAVDVATGKVASTSHIDNDTWVQERVLGGLSYLHSYDFSARLSWKDASQGMVSTAAPVRQKMRFTDQLKTMTFTTLNADVPVASLSGTVYRAHIEHSVATDPRVFKLPTVPHIKARKISKDARLITWGVADLHGGYPVTGYVVKVLLNGKVVASRTVSRTGKRRLVVRGLKWGAYRAQVDAANISGNHRVSSADFFVY